MYSKVRERKNDLINTTVLEVILAVIIILLCVVYIKDIEQKDMEKNYLERIAELQNQNDELEKTVRDLRRENKGLKDEIKRLNRKIERLTPRNPGEKHNIEKYEAEIETLEIKIKTLEAKIATLETKIAALEAELKTLRDKKKPVKSKARGGIDKPSCLIEDGKIEFFAEVTKEDGLFQFTATCSSANQLKVKNLPGAAGLLTNKAITLETLQNQARLLFRHGQESTPPCVYFVKLNPDVWLGSELKILERFFYKSYQ